MSMTTALVLMVTGTMAMAAGVHRPSIVRCTFALAVLAVAIGALMLWFAGGYDAFRSYDLGGGAVIRLALWQEAVRLVWENFPFGIGPGQFGELGYTEYNLSFSLNSDVLRWLGVDLSGPIFGALPMRFVHNTILAMLVDWGIVALLLMALLFTLIWRVIRMPPSAAAICYCLYLLPTLLLHDGLGFRAHYLILGLAIGSFLVPRKEVGDFSD
jgi:O-antigen ligase